MEAGATVRAAGEASEEAGVTVRAAGVTVRAAGVGSEEAAEVGTAASGASAPEVKPYKIINNHKTKINEEL